MRFMILVKATKGSEAGAMPTEQLFAAQLAFHEAALQAGVIRDAAGLKPTSHGWRIRFTEGGKAVIDGPFDEDNLIAGYTLIEVSSREEAMDWALRYADPTLGDEEGEIEVRPLFGFDDFAPTPSVERFRELGLMDMIAVDVGTSRPDLSGAIGPDGTVTILFTDIVESTRLNEQLGDRRWLQLISEHNGIVRHQLALHSGVEVKSLGDGFMLAFATARDGLECAVGIQQAFGARNQGGVQPALHVRIGLHTGEPIWEADDFFGRVVILAARIAAEARGSQILVTSDVRDVTAASGEFAFTAPMNMELKGLSGTHAVSAVAWDV